MMAKYQTRWNIILHTRCYPFTAAHLYLHPQGLSKKTMKVPIMQIWITKSTTTLVKFRDIYDLTFENDIETAFHPLHRKIMAVTKFQVMLNDLLLKHKASLLLYDEIIEVISSMYINSPDFN
jgi:hypothetical protein